MLKFKTSCAVLAYLSSNLLNEVGLSLFRYFEVGLRVWDIVVKKFTFAISSPDEFLYIFLFYEWPFLHVRNLEKKTLFSTLIQVSVFSDYVVFYGDSLHTYDSGAAWRATASAGTQLAMLILNKHHKNWELHPDD